MHVSFYTSYPSDKEFSWHHNYEWVMYFHLEEFHSKAPTNYVKILSVHPLVAFKFISLNSGVFASEDIISYTCSYAKSFSTNITDLVL